MGAMKPNLGGEVVILGARMQSLGIGLVLSLLLSVGSPAYQARADDSSEGRAYQLENARGDRDVDVEFMEQQIRACVEAAESSGDVRECGGQFANACMEEDPQWGMATVGMVFCIGTAEAVWSQMVSEFYEQALREMIADDDRDHEFGTPRGNDLPFRAPNLKASQVAWEKYQDAECTLQYARWRGGTGAPVLGAACRLRMNYERVALLYNLVYENG